MNTSNMAVQSSNTKAQQGFSLIELLVVVAIIGVLAAAGIVGYQSYLAGVKVDTHKNNVISLSKALDIVATTRSGGLSTKPAECGTSRMALTAASSSTVIGCVRQIADEGKFKSPHTQATAATYITDTVCGSDTFEIALSSNSSSITLTACGTNPLYVSTVSMPQ